MRILGASLCIDGRHMREVQLTGNGLGDQLVAVVRGDDGQIRIFRLGALRALRIQDAHRQPFILFPRQQHERGCNGRTVMCG